MNEQIVILQTQAIKYENIQTSIIFCIENQHVSLKKDLSTDITSGLGPVV